MNPGHRDLPYDFDLVAARLSEAGRTLLSLRMAGLRPAAMRCYWPDVPGMGHASDRPAAPGPRKISEMDEALPWISLIPEHELELRKLVGARALTSPRSGKPIYSWKALGRQLGCSDGTAKTWWIKGIEIIVRRLNQPGLCRQPAFRNTRQATSAAIGEIKPAAVACEVPVLEIA